MQGMQRMQGMHGGEVRGGRTSISKGMGSSPASSSTKSSGTLRHTHTHAAPLQLDRGRAVGDWVMLDGGAVRGGADRWAGWSSRRHAPRSMAASSSSHGEDSGTNTPVRNRTLCVETMGSLVACGDVAGMWTDRRRLNSV